MKLLEARHISFFIERPGPLDLLITATLVGKRVEISVDENDIVSVYVFRGDESVEIGMDAVLRAIEEGDRSMAATPLVYSASPCTASPSSDATWDAVRALYQNRPTAPNIFEVIEQLEARRIPFFIERPGPLDLLITAKLAGKRLEISVDVNDVVDVSVFRGDEAVEIGMEAVLTAIDGDE
jgi:hypothetical protein